jgi:hypothetical protein
VTGARILGRLRGGRSRRRGRVGELGKADLLGLDVEGRVNGAKEATGKDNADGVSSYTVVPRLLRLTSPPCGT